MKDFKDFIAGIGEINVNFHLFIFRNLHFYLWEYYVRPIGLSFKISVLLAVYEWNLDA